MKKYARLWLILILSLLTIFTLIRLGNIDISLNTLNRVNWNWYSLVIISFYASVIARGWRWQVILKTMGWGISFGYASTLLITGLFMSAILPARSGDVARVLMLKQDHEVPVAQGIASLAGERAMDVFSLLVLAIIGGWLALPGRLPIEVLELLVVVGALLILGLAGLLASPGIEPWLRQNRWLDRLMPAKLGPLYQKTLDFGFSLIHGVRQLGKKPAGLAFILAQSFFVWIWDGLMIYFTLLSLGIVAPFSASLFTGMVGALVTAIPLTPGALGQFDAAVISLLSLFDLSVSDASLTILLVRLVQLWSFMVVSGLVTYLFGFSRALSLGGTSKAAEAVPLTPSISKATEG